MFYVHLTRPSSHHFMPVRSRHLWNLPTILAEPNLHSQTGPQNKLKKTKCTVFIQHTQNMMAYEGETKIRQRGPGLSVHEVSPRQPNTVCANWGKPRWQAGDELFSWWDANIYWLYTGLKNKVPFHQSQIRGINSMGLLIEYGWEVIHRAWMNPKQQPHQSVTIEQMMMSSEVESPFQSIYLNTSHLETQRPHGIKEELNANGAKAQEWITVIGWGSLDPATPILLHGNVNSQRAQS